MRGVMLFVGLFASGSAHASNWGGFQDDGCRMPGLRQYSSILWNIPWFESWDRACRAQVGIINGVNQGVPDRCPPAGLNQWGEWDVVDGACFAYWGSIRDLGCVDGVHRFEGTLYNVPSDQTWEDACATTAAWVGGSWVLPTRCLPPGLNQLGQWDQFDPSCSTCGAPGACGGQAPDGCYCDDACAQYGDCCADKVEYCGY
ncbi:MAG: hypothetical protein ABMB14_10740 [Myxococcota bacterium]